MVSIRKLKKTKIALNSNYPNGKFGMNTFWEHVLKINLTILENLF